VLAAVGVPLCALAAGAQISRAKNDKLEPTAVVDLHSYPAGSVVVKRSRIVLSQKAGEGTMWCFQCPMVEH